MKKQDIKTIHEMLQQGMNTTEISLAVGIPSSTIRAHVRRHPELYGGKPCRTCGQVMVQLIGHLLHSYMRSLGKVSVVLGITLFGSIVRIAATLLLVPQIRMDGVFLGQIISWAADGLLSVVLFWFLYRTEEHIRRAVHTVHSGK